MTRQKLTLSEFQGVYTVADYDVLGWLVEAPGLGNVLL